MKQRLNYLKFLSARHASKAYAATGVAATLALSAPAHALSTEQAAVVDAWVTTATGDATDMFTKMFPLVAAVLGLGIVFTLFKRFGKKI